MIERKDKTGYHDTKIKDSAGNLVRIEWRKDGKLSSVVFPDNSVDVYDTDTGVLKSKSTPDGRVIYLSEKILTEGTAVSAPRVEKTTVWSTDNDERLKELQEKGSALTEEERREKDELFFQLAKSREDIETATPVVEIKEITPEIEASIFSLKKDLEKKEGILALMEKDKSGNITPAKIQNLKDKIETIKQNIADLQKPTQEAKIEEITPKLETPKVKYIKPTEEDMAQKRKEFETALKEAKQNGMLDAEEIAPAEIAPETPEEIENNEFAPGSNVKVLEPNGTVRYRRLSKHTSDGHGAVFAVPNTDGTQLFIEIPFDKLRSWQDLPVTSDAETAPKTPEEIKTTEAIGLEKKLDDARIKYAEEYKKFLAGAGWFTKSYRFVAGAKIDDSKIPPELKNLELEYDKVAVEYGNMMFQAKQTELENFSLSVDERKNELNQYKQTEIFTRVIVEEQSRLNALKVENLPPKEKNVAKKLLDWYIKQPRWKKLAISTALGTAIFATIAPGTVTAAGGIGAYATIRAARGVVGMTAGQITAKAYDWLLKDKSAEKRAAQEAELAEIFKEETFDVSFAKSKKEYAEILEREQKVKRNRLITKAMFGLAAGIGTSIEMGHLLNLVHVPDQLNVPRDPDLAQKFAHNPALAQNTTRPLGINPTPEKFIGPPFHPSQIHQDIGGIKGPQGFMNTNPTQEAMKLGMLTDKGESMIVQKGTMTFDDGHGHTVQVEYSSRGAIDTITKLKAKILETYGGDATKIPEGNLSTHYVDMHGVAHEQSLIHEQGGIETFKGDMFKPGQNIEHNLSTQHEVPNTETPTAHPAGTETHINPVNNIRAKLAEDYASASKANAENVINSDHTQIHPEPRLEHPDYITNHPEYAKNPFHLSGEKLQQTYEIHQENVHHIFPSDTKDMWDRIKGANAKQMLLTKPEDANEGFNSFFSYLKKLKEVTGKSPHDSALFGHENVEKYVARTEQYAAKHDMLDKIKY